MMVLSLFELELLGAIDKIKKFSISVEKNLNFNKDLISSIK